MTQRALNALAYDASRSPKKRLSPILGRLFAPVDIASLVFFRIAFGALMIWLVWKFFKYDMIVPRYVDPPLHFKYYGFEWVRPWPGDLMYVHFFALGALGACIMLGLCYRISTTLFFLGFTYLFLLEQSYYLNHWYMICLVSMLLIFIPTHRALSLDAAFRPSIRGESAPAWALWLLLAQIGIVYFYAGVAKLDTDWLRGLPIGIWLSDHTDFPLIGHLLTEHWMAVLCGWGSMLMDLLVTPLLLWRRTRLAAFAAASVFHLLNARLWDIGVFPWLMIAATALFFSPDWPRLRGLWRRVGSSEPRELAGPVQLRAGHWATIAVLGLYLAVQVLVPLRLHLYPGNPGWTEQGHRFAWRMMLRQKAGVVAFDVTDPIREETWGIDARMSLNSRQFDKLTGQPEMLLQFSRYLAEQYRQRGYDQVEVRAQVRVSLNGREPLLLVDPTVNLATEERTLRPVKWIQPLTEPLPSLAEAHANFAAVLETQANFSQAIDFYPEALEIMPDFADGRNYLGSVLAKAGSIEEAIKHYREALRIKPDFSDPHNNWGLALVQLGQIEQAIHHYSEALRIKPDNAQAHNNLANALLQQGKIEQALAHFYKAIRIAPKYTQAHNNLGVALAMQGRLDEAINHFSEASRLNLSDVQAHYNLAKALHEQGQIDQAMEQYREALRLRPDWAEVATKMAWIRATHENPRIRNAAEALKLAKLASEATDNQQPEALDTLAAAYAEAGRFENAVATARQALALATEAKQSVLANQIRQRLHLYETGQPFRDGTGVRDRQ